MLVAENDVNSGLGICPTGLDSEDSPLELESVFEKEVKYQFCFVKVLRPSGCC